jgi:hypothetical protein
VADRSKADRVADRSKADRVADRSKADRVADPAPSRLAPAGVLSKVDRVVNPRRADRVVDPTRADRVAVTGVMGLVADMDLEVAMGRAVVLRDLGALDHKAQGASQGQAAFRLLVVPATLLTPAVTEVVQLRVSKARPAASRKQLTQLSVDRTRITAPAGRGDPWDAEANGWRTPRSRRGGGTNAPEG